MADPKRPRILEWRPGRKGARAGFVTAQFPALHMTITNNTVFEKGTRRSAQPPSRPLLAADGSPLLDAEGKPRWAPLIKFDSREIGDCFSDNVVTALLEAHPRAFADGPAW